MKKIYILLLFVLIVSTTAFAQKSFSPIFMNEQGQKELIERSTLIVEGKLIKGKNQLLDNNSKEGYFYYLGVIKPTAVLKGNTDTTKTYQFLIKKGTYGFMFNTITRQYDTLGGVGLNPYHGGGASIPDYGIFFINEKPAPVASTFRKIEHDGKVTPIDLYSLFPNAIFVGYDYGINYKKYPKEQTLKYLQEKFNLKAMPLQ
ncbi:MAG: hypothetical protein HY958_14865 [Bacteroidia bacterium]|nr:hypothetical protein [Bacteroidia bacterium]